MTSDPANQFVGLVPAAVERGGMRSHRRHLALLGVAMMAGALGLGIFWGIRSRSAADSALKQTTAEAAISLVSVVSPKAGAPTQEILLPGTTQAFTDPRREALSVGLAGLTALPGGCMVGPTT